MEHSRGTLDVQIIKTLAHFTRLGLLDPTPARGCWTGLPGHAALTLQEQACARRENYADRTTSMPLQLLLSNEPNRRIVHSTLQILDVHIILVIVS